MGLAVTFIFTLIDYYVRGTNIQKLLKCYILFTYKSTNQDENSVHYVRTVVYSGTTCTHTHMYII